jgi:hypothetical protein
MGAKLIAVCQHHQFICSRSNFTYSAGTFGIIHTFIAFARDLSSHDA